MIKVLYPYILVSVLALISSSCFTGIESTPKITADDVKKEKVVETKEQSFLKEVSGQNFGQWQVGKVFYVTDDRINLIFGASVPTGMNLAGTELQYKGYKVANAVTGETVTDIIFSSADIDSLVFRVNAPPEELKKRDVVEVPFTIEESLIADTRVKLQGQMLYILTSSWNDKDGQKVGGRKYVLVKITDVQRGNNIYPVKVLFDDGDKTYSVFMSVGRIISSSRAFDSLFSFEDPHKKYPEISDEIWENIILGKVVLDMTREECRLALGAPKEIDRRPGYGGVQEIWGYEDGVYLIFEDGLLRSFRK